MKTLKIDLKKLNNCSSSQKVLSLISGTMNIQNCYGKYEVALKQSLLKINDLKKSIQKVYDYILASEGMYSNLGGQEKDSQFIKHKDRKQGWWD